MREATLYLGKYRVQDWAINFLIALSCIGTLNLRHVKLL